MVKYEFLEEVKEIRRTSTKPEKLNESESNSSSSKSESKEDEEEEDKPIIQSECQKKTIAFIDSWQWGIFMTIVTIYTLFFDDIRVVFIPKVADDAFFTITTVCFLLFLFEIILSSIYIPKYWMGFFFWLDVLSTVSMLFDLGWIMDNVNNASQADSASSLAKSSRAARVTRIVRLVRLIRLVRIVKLYKQAKLAQQRREEAKLKELRLQKGIVDEEENTNTLTKREGLQRRRTSIKDGGLFVEGDDDAPAESKLSKTLSDKSTKILIILILTTLFLTPLFQVNTYFQAVVAPEFGLDQLMLIYKQRSELQDDIIYVTARETYVGEMINYDYPLIELECPGLSDYKHGDAKDDLRSDEFTIFTSDYDSKGTYSVKTFNQYES